MTRIAFAASLALSAALLASSAPPAQAATETVLYSFKHKCCGAPRGQLHFKGGSLFGTGSGPDPDGQVFELTDSGGTWKETSVLFFNGADGAAPGAGLIQNSDGILFGTTSEGDLHGFGNVFALYKDGSSWVHTTLWAFEATGDGQIPYCDLVMDSSGNLYGTTTQGGAYNYGTVFELTETGGVWSELVLHSFVGDGKDGVVPGAGLLMDKTGALYGTTVGGGVNGYGAVFELTQSGGVWSETVLHSFGSGNDGQKPQDVLVRSSKGALLGTTGFGGAYGNGIVFKLFQSGGAWKEQVIHAFTGGSDGATPLAGLRWSGTGALYGTAAYGGAHNKGVVFELTQSGGVWSESVLHSFGTSGDGLGPSGAVVLDKNGVLYGTTAGGGDYGWGTVWEVAL